MATGGSAAASLTSQSKNEALTCALCLDIYRQPKLLPCSHTFCLKCLKDLVDQASSKVDSGDGAQPLKTHEKDVAAVEGEVAELYSEKDSGVLPDVGDQNENAVSEGVGSFALFTSDQAEKDCDRPKAANDLNLNVGQAIASTEDQNQTDEVTQINDSIEEKIYVQFPASADDPENEKNVESTIGFSHRADGLAGTQEYSGIKGEDDLTASTTSGYAYPSGEDIFASEVFSAEGVSQVDPQEYAAANSGENVPENAENIQKPTKFFLCPSCREQIKVPEGGASGFQNNVYIREDELERAREEVLGLTHSCKTYDLFCVRCDTLICINCKLSGHLHHESQTLAEAAANAKTTISQNKARLKSAREGLENNADERATDRQQFADKKDLLEKEIRQRRSKIVAAADKYCDEALTALKKTFTTSATKDSKALDDVNKNISKIRGLQERMHNAETSNNQCELVLVAKELRCGNGSHQVVDKLASLPRLSEISRPVLSSSAEHDDFDKMFTTMEHFIGTAKYLKMKTSEPEISAELIQCEGVAPNAECFCVCPHSVSGGLFFVSFVPSFENQEPLRVNGAGKTTFKFDSRGIWENKKVSFVSRRDKTSMFIHNVNDKDSVDILYAKSHTKQIFRLEKSDGGFSIATNTVVSNDPFKTDTNTVFAVISYGNIQAFDMNDQEQIAAVIFENKKTKARQVKLFRRPPFCGRRAETAVATYTPQMTTSVLSDVCFFTLQGQEVLLIADEANDAIHVVEVKDDKMTFSRFLCPGCPLLLQPTALNTDHKGRLWVGCRGGRLVCFEPLSP